MQQVKSSLYVSMRSEWNIDIEVGVSDAEFESGYCCFTLCGIRRPPEDNATSKKGVHILRLKLLSPSQSRFQGLYEVGHSFRTYFMLLVTPPKISQGPVSFNTVPQ